MAKRFTNTEKWKTPFLRGLKGPYKLLWLYIQDECDHTGIWQVDFPVAQLKTGEKLKEQDAIKLFGKKIILLEEGQKWFIPEFVEDQYGQLSEENRAHKKVIETLRKFFLIDENFKIKDLISPLQGAKDMDKEQEEDKEKDKEKNARAKTSNENVIVLPFESDDFLDAWQGWKDYKKVQHGFIYKSVQTEQAALVDLSKISGGREPAAIEIIRISIAKGWKGLFEIKNNGQSTSKNGQQGSLNANYKRDLVQRVAQAAGQGGNEPG